MLTRPLVNLFCLFSATLTLFGYDTSLKDFEIKLEDGAKQDIIVLFEGPNRTPYDWATVEPGKWSIDVSDLPPDRYTLTFYSEGYAEQFANITYKDGEFIVQDSDNLSEIILYKKLWVTIELVWNTRQERALTGENTEQAIFNASYLARHRTIGPDYSFTQTSVQSNSRRVSRASGPDLVLSCHRYSGFFGVSYPEEGERFEDATLAPPNDKYKSDPYISLDPGTWFYLRISGHTPTTIAYVKARVLAVGKEPIHAYPILKERDLSWIRAQETAERLGKPLAK